MKIVFLSGLTLSLVFGWVVLLIVYGHSVGAGIALAAPCPAPQPLGIPKADGLISAQNIISPNFFNTSGICVNGAPASIDLTGPKVDSFGQLFATYYRQNRFGEKIRTLPGIASGLDYTLNGTPATNQLDTGSGTHRLYNYPGNLTIGPNAFTGSKVALIFVQGNLIINSNITYAAGINDAGLVFIVKGQVFINGGAPRASQVQQINAVIIADGSEVGPTAYSICTACTSVGTPNSLFVDDGSNWDNMLTINGNLVALNNTRTILFKRGLQSNSDASEVINFDPKYLVILKDLISSNLKIWTEL